MKWNWGWGIAAVYTLFVAGMLGMVIKSTQYDNSLVADDYYAQDIAYQKHYDKVANSLSLETDLVIALDEGMVTLHFPRDLGPVSGQIHFFCPSDSKQDFLMPVHPSREYVQRVPVAAMKKGLWKVKVDWEAAGKPYFKEETLYL